MSTILKIDDIRTDGGTQPRASIDYQAVQDYADAMEAGVRFPPVVVFYDGTHYWLADGFHRAQAALLAGREEITAQVLQGTLEDAQWFSFGANKDNGIRRDNRDKQRAVQLALRHPQSQRLSDSALAKHVGVSVHTVGNHRKELESSLKIAKIESRTATRNGVSYQINTTKIGRRPTRQPEVASPAATDSVAGAQSDDPDRGIAEWTLRVCRACGEIAACPVTAQDLAASIRRGNSSEQLKQQLETTNELIATVLADLA
jgi:transposase-like protein/uncharacterized ParB-like nuclease family protein